MLNSVYLLFGANLGDKQNTIRMALTMVSEQIGNVEKCSKMYETAAWGNTNQPEFYNCVALAKTNLSAIEVLHKILEIEKKLGRERGEKIWEARTIDIDILFYNQTIFKNEELEIPHPRLHLRNFTLAPLNEIASNLIHPLLKKTIAELFAASEDKLGARLI